MISSGLCSALTCSVVLGFEDRELRGFELRPAHELGWKPAGTFVGATQVKQKCHGNKQ